MTLTYTITKKGDFSKSLNNLKNFQRHMSAPMEKTVNWIIDDVAEYKPKAKGAFSRFATLGQKRAYWAKVRRGIIRHGANGYVRTGNTGRKWTKEIKRHSGGVQGVIGNNEPHAIYVHTEAHQQRFHKETGFMTVEKAFEKNKRKIDNEFDKAFREAANQ